MSQLSVCDTPIISGPNKGKSARGTVAGYGRHNRRKETPCDECRVAWNEAERLRINADPVARAAKRQWYLDNRESENARARQWHIDNPVRSREVHREWREANREAANARASRWRARRYSATVHSITQADIDAKVAYWGGRCWMCFDTYSEIDHVKPLAAGGPHILANLRPICRSCNSSKGATWPLI